MGLKAELPPELDNYPLTAKLFKINSFRANIKNINQEL